MLDVITDNLDIWTTAQKQKKAVGRGKAKKEEGYGIKKLRELILELAVRGKLVPQDPKDEPASVLLEKIAEEKQRLIDEGKIKKQKALPEIEEDEKPFEIPETWRWVRLAQISNANTGFAFKSTEYKETGTLVLRVININNDTSINLSNNKYIDPVIAKEKYAKFSLKNGDVLLVMVGGSLGKVGVVSSDVLPAVLNQNMWKLNTFADTNGKYFVAGIKYINRNQITVTKSTHGHLAQGAYMEKLFPLPPLAEQHRIVAKVDELMALCDQLEQEQADHQATHQTLVKTLLNGLTLRQPTLRQAQGERNSPVHGEPALRRAQGKRNSPVQGERYQHHSDHPEPVEGLPVEGAPVEGHASTAPSEFEQAWNLIEKNFDTLFTTEDSIDQLKQTILQLAVMGKLVPQNPKDEPASVLLEKIAQEKARLIKEGKIKKQKALPEITEDEKPFGLPEGWEWTKLGSISFINPRNTASDKVIASFVPMSLISTSTTGDHGKETRDWGSIKKGFTHFSNGDIGLAKITPCFQNSKAVIFSNLVNGIGAGTTELYIARPYGKTLCSQYILCFLKSPHYLLLGESKMTGTAGQKRLPKTFFTENPLPLPPLAEQHRIVTKVNQLLSLCDTLKANLNQAQTTQAQLADTIVKQAVN